MSYTANSAQYHDTSTIIQGQPSYYGAHYQSSNVAYDQPPPNPSQHIPFDYLTAQHNAGYENQYRGGELPKAMVKRPDSQPQVSYQESSYQSDPYDQYGGQYSAAQYYGAQSTNMNPYSHEQYPTQDGYQLSSNMDPYHEQYSAMYGSDAAQYPGSSATSDPYEQQYIAQGGPQDPSNTNSVFQEQHYPDEYNGSQGSPVLRKQYRNNPYHPDNNPFPRHKSKVIQSQKHDDMDISGEDQDENEDSCDETIDYEFDEKDPYSGILGDRDLPDSDHEDANFFVPKPIPKHRIESKVELISASKADNIYPPSKRKLPSHQWFETTEHFFPVGTLLHNLIVYIPLDNLKKRKYNGINKYIFATGHRYNIWLDPFDSRYLCFRKLFRRNIESQVNNPKFTTLQCVSYERFVEGHGIIRLLVDGSFYNSPLTNPGVMEQLRTAIPNVVPPEFSKTVCDGQTNIWIASIQNTNSKGDQAQYPGSPAKMKVFQHSINKHTEAYIQRNASTFYFRHPDMIVDACPNQPERPCESMDILLNAHKSKPEKMTGKEPAWGKNRQPNAKGKQTRIMYNRYR